MAGSQPLAVAIAQALAPAEVEQVLLYPWIHRAVALVPSAHIASAIGPLGKTVKRASLLLSIDIEVMTRRDLAAQIELARTQFVQFPGATREAVDRLIEQGLIYLEDIALLDEDELAQAVGIDRVTAVQWIAYADRVTSPT